MNLTHPHRFLHVVCIRRRLAAGVSMEPEKVKRDSGLCRKPPPDYASRLRTFSKKFEHFPTPDVLTKNNSFMHTAIYLRVSTNEQRLDSQEHELRAHCQRRGWD